MPVGMVCVCVGVSDEEAGRRKFRKGSEHCNFFSVSAALLVIPD